MTVLVAFKPILRCNMFIIIVEQLNASALCLFAIGKYEDVIYRTSFFDVSEQMSHGQDIHLYLVLREVKCLQFGHFQCPSFIQTINSVFITHHVNTFPMCVSVIRFAYICPR